MEDRKLTQEELASLEYLLKKLYGIAMYPYRGCTWQKWADDHIVAKEFSQKGQVKR